MGMSSVTFLSLSAWGSSKQGLAQQVRDLRVPQDDTAKVIASALDYGGMLDVDLNMSARGHCHFQERDDHDRAELDDVYLRTDG